MSERRFKSQVTEVLTEPLPDTAGGALENWLAPTTESRVEQIPVEQIRDRTWRGDVDTTEPAYRALKASIRASGVLQPLLLRPRPDGGFEVVSGARRLRAARETVQSTVPAVVRELTDVQALVGGSWDAVLRTGLSPREARELTAQLVEAGMEEGKALSLVGTAPVREDVDVAALVETAPAESAPVSLAEAAIAADAVASEGVASSTAAAQRDVAAVEVSVEPEAVAEAVVESDAAAGPSTAAAAEAEVAAEAESTVVAEAVVESHAAAGPSTAAAAEAEVAAEAESTAVAEAAPSDAGVAEPAPSDADVAEASEGALAGAAWTEPPAVEAATAAAASVAETPADTIEPDTMPPVDALEVDAEAAGWPAPDDGATGLAPAAPPAEAPDEPTVLPEPSLAGTGEAAAASSAPSTEAAASEPAVEAASAEDHVAAEPAEPSVELPVEFAAEPAAEPLAELGAEAAEPAAGLAADADTDASAATSVQVSVEPVPTAAATPHVIPIKLPEPATAVPADEAEAGASGSLPVAAPTAAGDSAGTADGGSRLVDEPIPAVRMEAPSPFARSSTALPSMLRRGPLFYAVLGIGLAVGAIVFILVTVVEGVGSGATPIIAAVVVAVLGFVSAMVSLAQPRERR